MARKCERDKQVEVITEKLKEKKEAKTPVYGIITQKGKKDFDFALRTGSWLASYIKDVGDCYVCLTDVNTDCERFYTVFDDARDGMPDQRWPFVGMLSVFKTEKDALDFGGSILVWVKGSEGFTAYDLEDYNAEMRRQDAQTESLGSFKVLPL